MVMACVFDPLLPGICLHVSYLTLFLGPIAFLFLFRIILLFSLLFASWGVMTVEVLGL